MFVLRGPGQDGSPPQRFVNRRAPQKWRPGFRAEVGSGPRPREGGGDFQSLRP